MEATFADDAEFGMITIRIIAAGSDGDLTQSNVEGRYF